MGIRAKFVRALNESASAACSNNTNRQPANEPLSRATTTGVATETGPGASGITSGNSPAEGGIRASSGAPASMMEGACPQAAPLPTAKDRTACMKSCQGLDEPFRRARHASRSGNHARHSARRNTTTAEVGLGEVRDGEAAFLHRRLQSGMFVCFFGGLVSRLSLSISSARWRRFRSVRG